MLNNRTVIVLERKSFFFFRKRVKKTVKSAIVLTATKSEFSFHKMYVNDVEYNTKDKSKHKRVQI